MWGFLLLDFCELDEVIKIIGIEYQTLAGLEKSPKSCLKALEDALVLNLKPEEWK